MTYYCDECEMVIREEDVENKEDFLAEAWGRPIYENYLACPVCGEPVREFYGEIELEKVYNNSFINLKNLLGRRIEDDEY